MLKLKINGTWILILNIIIGINTWDRYRKKYSKIKYLNNLKWLQYQILYRYVKTNKVVSNFAPNVIDICTFCRYSSETIKYFFFSCYLTNTFIEETTTFIRQFYLNFSITKIKFLFGDINREAMDLENVIMLTMKGFKWCSKFKKKCASLNDFKKYVKIILENLKIVHDLCYKSVIFSEHFETMYLSLVQ